MSVLRVLDRFIKSACRDSPRESGWDRGGVPALGPAPPRPPEPSIQCLAATPPLPGSQRATGVRGRRSLGQQTTFLGSPRQAVHPPVVSLSGAN